MSSIANKASHSHAPTHTHTQTHIEEDILRVFNLFVIMFAHFLMLPFRYPTRALKWGIHCAVNESNIFQYYVIFTILFSFQKLHLITHLIQGIQQPSALLRFRLFSLINRMRNVCVCFLSFFKVSFRFQNMRRVPHQFDSGQPNVQQTGTTTTITTAKSEEKHNRNEKTFD